MGRGRGLEDKEDLYQGGGVKGRYWGPRGVTFGTRIHEIAPNAKRERRSKGSTKLQIVRRANGAPLVTPT